MSSITNGNDYQRGWNDGHRAALEGKDKNYSKMVFSWKYVFHNEFAMKTYSEGYDKGYEEGLKEAHVTQKVKITNISDINLKHPGNMEKKNSLNVQSILTEIGALKGLNGLLVEFINDLVMMDRQFRTYISSLSDTGVQKEICKNFEDNFYKADADNMKAIASNIMNRDLPIIRKYHESLAAQFRTVSGFDSDFRFSTPDSSTASVSTHPNQLTIRKGGPQDYVVQLDACCDLMDFLVEQCEKMAFRRNTYQDYCKELEAKGIPTQVAQHYNVNFAQPNIMMFNKTISHVQNEDYPHLREIYRSILNSLMELDPYHYNRGPRRMPDYVK